jgi:ATP-dependent DNA helicase RecQ
LLHYFGEQYNEEECQNCDNCLHPKEKFEGKEDVVRLLKVILAVKQLFKAKHVVNVLLGKNSASLKQYKHHKLDEFGLGADMDEKFWNAVIRQCLIHQLLYKDIENYGLLKLTPEGYKFLEEPFSIMLTHDHDYDNPEEEELYDITGGNTTSAVDKTLFALLKDLRKEISRKENLPPYIIFQDPSLEDMAIQYPMHVDELKNITGVGTGKASKYGKPFLELIAKYVEENEIIRPIDMVVKSVVNKSGLKVYLIQNVDRKISLDDIANSKGITLEELLVELESIVSSGTRIDINYYINEVVDMDHQNDIINYFKQAETDSINDALVKLGEDEFTEEEIRLMRIKFLSEFGN